MDCHHRHRGHHPASSRSRSTHPTRGRETRNDAGTRAHSRDSRSRAQGNTALDKINCVLERVRSSRALTELVEQALARRVTDSNSYNEHSSRSHVRRERKGEEGHGERREREAERVQREDSPEV